MDTLQTASLTASSPIRVRSVETFALEAALPRMVETPMMAISSVVSLLVVVRDEDGIEGWGEIWCNFPRFGIHHRARLLKEVFAPLLVRDSFASPAAAWASMTASSNVLRLQSGEPGPLAAVIAGIDIALHDLVAKRAGLPLWRMLGGQSGKVPVYASLGRAVDTGSTVERCLEQGFRAIKLHSAGGVADHVAAVRPVRKLVGDACELMLDLNSSWDPEEAIATIGQLEEDRLSWLEEPIPADAPAEVWRRLFAAAPMPLAGGENLLSLEALRAAIADGVLTVLQPDITKWGGFSGCLPIAREIIAGGRRFCPHMFSGAPGLLAAAHLVAASNSPTGLLEFSVGFNPLRDALLNGGARDGVFDLGESPGLGLQADIKQLKKYLLPI
jgi:L-alanine-DL-glutamate epimerase-like enolase superfamily enzyme